MLRKEFGFLEGKHRGLHVILIGRLVILEGSDTERGGDKAVEIELTLGDTSEVRPQILHEAMEQATR